MSNYRNNATQDGRNLRRNRSDGRLKTYKSSNDCRVWNLNKHERHDYISDYIASSYERFQGDASEWGRYVPVPVLVDLVVQSYKDELQKLHSKLQKVQQEFLDCQDGKKGKKHVESEDLDNQVEEAIEEPAIFTREERDHEVQAGNINKQDRDSDSSQKDNSKNEGEYSKGDKHAIMEEEYERERQQDLDNIQENLIHETDSDSRTQNIRETLEEINSDFDKLMDLKEKEIKSLISMQDSIHRKVSNEERETSLQDGYPDFYETLRHYENDVEEKEREVKELLQSIQSQVMEEENERINRLDDESISNTLNSRDRQIMEGLGMDERLDSQNEEFAKLKGEIDILSVRLAALESSGEPGDVDKYNKRKEENEIQDLQDSLAVCKKTLKNERFEKEEVENQLEKCREEISRYKIKSEEKDRELSYLKDKLNRCMEEKEELELKLDTLSTSKRRSSKQLERSEELISELESKHEREIKSLNDKISQMKKQLKEREEEMDELQDKYQKLLGGQKQESTEVKNAKQLANELEEKLRKSEEENTILKEKLEKLEDEIMNKNENEKDSATGSEHEKIKALNDELQKQNESLKLDLENAQTQLKHKTGSMDNLNKTLDIMKERLEDRDKELVEMNETNQELLGELLQLRQRYAEEDEVKDKKLSELEQMLEKCSNEKRDFEQRQNELETEIAELKENYQKLLDQCETQLKYSGEHLDKKDQELSELNIKLKNCDNDRKELDIKIQKLENELAGMEKAYENLFEENQTLQMEQKKEESRQEKENLLQEALENCQASKKILEGRLEEIEKELGGLQKSYQDLLDENQLLRVEQKQNQDIQANEAQQNLLLKEKMLQNCENEKKNLKEQIEKLETQLTLTSLTSENTPSSPGKIELNENQTDNNLTNRDDNRDAALEDSDQVSKSKDDNNKTKPTTDAGINPETSIRSSDVKEVSIMENKETEKEIADILLHHQTCTVCKDEAERILSTVDEDIKNNTETEGEKGNVENPDKTKINVDIEEVKENSPVSQNEGIDDPVTPMDNRTETGKTSADREEEKDLKFKEEMTQTEGERVVDNNPKPGEAIPGRQSSPGVVTALGAQSEKTTDQQQKGLLTGDNESSNAEQESQSKEDTSVAKKDARKSLEVSIIENKETEKEIADILLHHETCNVCTKEAKRILSIVEEGENNTKTEESMQGNITSKQDTSGNENNQQDSNDTEPSEDRLSQSKEITDSTNVSENSRIKAERTDKDVQTESMRKPDGAVDESIVKSEKSLKEELAAESTDMTNGGQTSESKDATSKDILEHKLDSDMHLEKFVTVIADSETSLLEFEKENLERELEEVKLHHQTCMECQEEVERSIHIVDEKDKKGNEKRENEHSVGNEIELFNEDGSLTKFIDNVTETAQEIAESEERRKSQDEQPAKDDKQGIEDTPKQVRIDQGLELNTDSKDCSQGQNEHDLGVVGEEFKQASYNKKRSSIENNAKQTSASQTSESSAGLKLTENVSNGQPPSFNNEGYSKELSPNENNAKKTSMPQITSGTCPGLAMTENADPQSFDNEDYSKEISPAKNNEKQIRMLQITSGSFAGIETIENGWSQSTDNDKEISSDKIIVKQKSMSLTTPGSCAGLTGTENELFHIDNDVGSFEFRNEVFGDVSNNSPHEEIAELGFDDYYTIIHDKSINYTNNSLKRIIKEEEKYMKNKKNMDEVEERKGQYSSNVSIIFGEPNYQEVETTVGENENDEENPSFRNKVFYDNDRLVNQEPSKIIKTEEIPAFEEIDTLCPHEKCFTCMERLKYDLKQLKFNRLGAEKLESMIEEGESLLNHMSCNSCREDACSILELLGEIVYETGASRDERYNVEQDEVQKMIADNIPKTSTYEFGTDYLTLKNQSDFEFQSLRQTQDSETSIDKHSFFRKYDVKESAEVMTSNSDISIDSSNIQDILNDSAFLYLENEFSSEKITCQVQSTQMTFSKLRSQDEMGKLLIDNEKCIECIEETRRILNDVNLMDDLEFHKQSLSILDIAEKDMDQEEEERELLTQMLNINSSSIIENTDALNQHNTYDRCLEEPSCFLYSFYEQADQERKNKEQFVEKSIDVLSPSMEDTHLLLENKGCSYFIEEPECTFDAFHQEMCQIKEKREQFAEKPIDVLSPSMEDTRLLLENEGCSYFIEEPECIFDAFHQEMCQMKEERDKLVQKPSCELCAEAKIFFLQKCCKICGTKTENISEGIDDLWFINSIVSEKMAEGEKLQVTEVEKEEIEVGKIHEKLSLEDIKEERIDSLWMELKDKERTVAQLNSKDKTDERYNLSATTLDELISEEKLQEITDLTSAKGNEEEMYIKTSIDNLASEEILQEGTDLPFVEGHQDEGFKQMPVDKSLSEERIHEVANMLHSKEMEKESYELALVGMIQEGTDSLSTKEDEEDKNKQMFVEQLESEERLQLVTDVLPKEEDEVELYMQKSSDKMVPEDILHEETDLSSIKEVKEERYTQTSNDELESENMPHEATDLFPNKEREEESYVPKSIDEMSSEEIIHEGLNLLFTREGEEERYEQELVDKLISEEILHERTNLPSSKHDEGERCGQKSLDELTPEDETLEGTDLSFTKEEKEDKCFQKSVTESASKEMPHKEAYPSSSMENVEENHNLKLIDNLASEEMHEETDSSFNKESEKGKFKQVSIEKLAFEENLHEGTDIASVKEEKGERYTQKSIDILASEEVVDQRYHQNEEHLPDVKANINASAYEIEDKTIEGNTKDVEHRREIGDDNVDEEIEKSKMTKDISEIQKAQSLSSESGSIFDIQEQPSVKQNETYHQSFKDELAHDDRKSEKEQLTQESLLILGEDKSLEGLNLETNAEIIRKIEMSIGDELEDEGMQIVTELIVDMIKRVSEHYSVDGIQPEACIKSLSDKEVSITPSGEENLETEIAKTSLLQQTFNVCVKDAELNLSEISKEARSYVESKEIVNEETETKELNLMKTIADSDIETETAVNEVEDDKEIKSFDDELSFKHKCEREEELIKTPKANDGPESTIYDEDYEKNQQKTKLTLETEPEIEAEMSLIEDHTLKEGKTQSMTSDGHDALEMEKIIEVPHEDKHQLANRLSPNDSKGRDQELIQMKVRSLSVENEKQGISEFEEAIVEIQHKDDTQKLETEIPSEENKDGDGELITSALTAESGEAVILPYEMSNTYEEEYKHPLEEATDKTIHEQSEQLEALKNEAETLLQHNDCNVCTEEAETVLEIMHKKEAEIEEFMKEQPNEDKIQQMNINIDNTVGMKFSTEMSEKEMESELKFEELCNQDLLDKEFKTEKTTETKEAATYTEDESHTEEIEEAAIILGPVSEKEKKVSREQLMDDKQFGFQSAILDEDPETKQEKTPIKQVIQPMICKEESSMENETTQKTKEGFKTKVSLDMMLEKTQAESQEKSHPQSFIERSVSYKLPTVHGKEKKKNDYPFDYYESIFELGSLKSQQQELDISLKHLEEEKRHFMIKCESLKQQLAAFKGEEAVMELFNMEEFDKDMKQQLKNVKGSIAEEKDPVVLVELYKQWLHYGKNEEVRLQQQVHILQRTSAKLAKELSENRKFMIQENEKIKKQQRTCLETDKKEEYTVLVNVARLQKQDEGTQRIKDRKRKLCQCEDDSPPHKSRKYLPQSDSEDSPIKKSTPDKKNTGKH